MEKGSKSILILLGFATLLGLLVLALNPDYRRTAVVIAAGAPERSPIWRSNEAYYDGIEIGANGGEGGTSHAP